MRDARLHLSVGAAVWLPRCQGGCERPGRLGPFSPRTSLRGRPAPAEGAESTAGKPPPTPVIPVVGAEPEAHRVLCFIHQHRTRYLGENCSFRQVSAMLALLAYARVPSSRPSRFLLGRLLAQAAGTAGIGLRDVSSCWPLGEDGGMNIGLQLLSVETERGALMAERQQQTFDGKERTMGDAGNKTKAQDSPDLEEPVGWGVGCKA